RPGDAKRAHALASDRKADQGGSGHRAKPCFVRGKVDDLRHRLGAVSVRVEDDARRRAEKLGELGGGHGAKGDHEGPGGALSGLEHMERHDWLSPTNATASAARTTSGELPELGDGAGAGLGDEDGAPGSKAGFSRGPTSRSAP